MSCSQDETPAATTTTDVPSAAATDDDEDLERLSRAELIARLRTLSTTTTTSSSATAAAASTSGIVNKRTGGGLSEPNEVFKSAGSSARTSSSTAQAADAHRRESILVMRLAAKEQEVHDFYNQVEELRTGLGSGLRNSLLDPVVNSMYRKLIDELRDTKQKLEQSQQELNAWKFTPDSTTGKRLMARCRTLIQENEDLGRMVEQGRVGQLHNQLAVQTAKVAELNVAHGEMDELLVELDQDMEGLQTTVMFLQQQLSDVKQQQQQPQQEEQQTSNGNGDDESSTTAAAAVVEQPEPVDSDLEHGVNGIGTESLDSQPAAAAADDQVTTAPHTFTLVELERKFLTTTTTVTSCATSQTDADADARQTRQTFVGTQFKTRTPSPTAAASDDDDDDETSDAGQADAPANAVRHARAPRGRTAAALKRRQRSNGELKSPPPNKLKRTRQQGDHLVDLKA